MTRFTDWCAFLGAWLLFAGPVYQAESELDGEALEGQEFMAAAHAVELPAPPSPWWWLLPPVAWQRTRSHNREVRRRVQAVLSRTQIEQLVSFSEKATGWLMVAGGAGLISIDETWALAHKYGWGVPVFVLLCVAMAAVSVTFTAVRSRRRHEMLATEPAGRRQHGENASG